MTELIPSERQEQIVRLLQIEKRLTIKQLAARFGVSSMTIHRDLERLEGEGLVKKVHGGVMLQESSGALWGETAVCQLCGGAVMKRTGFTVMRESGEKMQACCPHCGILLMQQIPDIVSALTPDFLHGRRVNIYQAFFLIGSEVRVCCLPSALCFATRQEAEKFQQGFGGEVLDFAGAMLHLRDCHHGG